MVDFARFLNVRSALDPVLSPDDSRVAFLSDITGNFQVWSVATRGEGAAQWPRQLTFLPNKVWELHGAPNAPWLIAVSDVDGNERQQFYLVSNFGADEAGHEAHTVRRLTSDDDAIHEFGAWNKECTQIAYTSNARNGVDFDVYRMEIATGHAERIHETKGLRSVCAWSPDGKSLLLVDEVSSLQEDVYLLELATREERQLLPADKAGRYHSISWTRGGIFAITDVSHDRGAVCRIDPETGAISTLVTADDLPGSGEFEALDVASDGRTGALTVNNDGYSELYLLDLRTGALSPVDLRAKGVLTSVRFNPRGTFIVMTLSTPAANPDIWSVRVVDGSLRQLTFSNRAGIDFSTLIAPRTVHFASFDDLRIPAFLYMPTAHRKPAGGFPTILYVHGGPASQHRPEFFVSFQFLLQQGFAILAPNVRGSTGYGRDYTQMDEIERRMDSVADLKAAVEWIAQQPELDATRIAVYGRSYGGFMVLAALTEYPDLFTAGIDVVGISNWVTFLERTGPWRRSHREKEYGDLERDRAFLERISPVHKADRIRVPLMVMAGDNDPRVPLAESEQVAERVRAGSGSVEFVHYSDEGHNFSRLENRIDSFTRIAEFLHRTLAAPHPPTTRKESPKAI